MTPSLERPAESASPSPSARLRHLMQQGMVVAPFVYDGLRAKMAQQAGLQVVYLTGFGTAAVRGYPDVGLLTLLERVQNAGYISNTAPCLADDRFLTSPSDFCTKRLPHRFMAG